MLVKAQIVSKDGEVIQETNYFNHMAGNSVIIPPMEISED